MRVGIDAHSLGKRKTGNETYTLSLVKHLARLEPDGIKYTVYVGANWKLEEGIGDNTCVRSKPIRPENPLLRIPFGFAVESRMDKLDVLHAQYLLPHHLRCRTILTVHDILYERFPQYFTAWDRCRMKVGVRRSCLKADHVITVSESSKRDLLDVYDLDPSRVSVTYLGPDASYRPMDRLAARERLRTRYDIGEDFLLYVGAIQPRKNIPRLLSAFALAKREFRLPHKLVIVGPKAWMSQSAFRALESCAVKDDVIVTGYVPREDLPFFYNAAAVFLYVSLCEGFGLPVVEAMACGTPSITSRGSSLEEIAGHAAVLVDPTDEQAIAAAIVKVLSDSDVRATLAKRGIERSADFSLAQMATQTQNLYRSLMS